METLKGYKVVFEQEFKTATDPYQIVLEPDRKVIKADGLDLTYITVRIIDKNGITVPNADRLVNFKVTGVGEIAGVTNSNIFSDEKWNADQRSTYYGKCIRVVRTNRKEGNINVTVSRKGFPDANCVKVSKKF
ncbi:MAG: hypothetical protein ABSF81_16160 [Bacteroidales bacterium]